MTAKNAYVDIVDRGCLAELLGAEMGRRRLNQPQAAKLLRIAQGTISKLLRGRRARLDLTAIYRLAEFLPNRERARLEKALLGAEAREILKAQRAWLDESLKPYREPPIPDPGYKPELIRSVPRPPWRWNTRSQNAFTAVDMLLLDHEVSQEIRGFLRKAAKLRFTTDADELTADRLRLALIHVFDPIAGGEGGVERQYEELQQSGELQKYLKHAFNRELILLRRASDLERAQEMGSALREVRPRFVRVVTDEDDLP